MPFGSGFYVSEWFWEQRRRIGLLALLVVAALIWVGWTIGSHTTIPLPIHRLLYRTFGYGTDVEVIFNIGFTAATVLAGIIGSALWFGEAVDGMLMRIPLIGYVYERWLRRVTYYRYDRTQAFQAAAHSALCSVIDEICETQGITPLSDAARASSPDP